MGLPLQGQAKGSTLSGCASDWLELLKGVPQRLNNVGGILGKATIRKLGKV